MIAKLRGLVDSRGEDWVILDVHGVGYLVFCSARTLGKLPSVGAEALLHIETHVREDSLALYGFADLTERDWFRLLTTVQGVGNRVGLALLSALAPDHLSRAIAAQDKAFLTQANGVGPKLAARIVTELKDKAATMPLGGDLAASTGGMAIVSAGTEDASSPLIAGALPSTPQTHAAVDDALSALANLGYGRTEAYGVISVLVATSEQPLTASELIRLSLKELGKALVDKMPRGGS